MELKTERRPLGATGPQLSAVGFGCMGLTGWYGTRDDEESRATLLAALEQGVNHFDTAASYQLGENERFVGEVLRPWRDRVFVASKGGLARGPGGSAVADNRPQTLRRLVDEGLARLGFDAIDLYYLHRIDRTVPIEESVGTLAELVKAGKIRHIGLSECSVSTLRRAAAVHPVAAVQSEYSVWSREPEQGMLAACRELGTTFVAYSPLGRGYLAGNFDRLSDLPADDSRHRQPRFQDGAVAQNHRIVELLRTIGAAHGASPAQMAIAWVLSRGPHVITIPGMKTRAHLADNLAGGRLQLAAGELQQIDALLATHPVAGERHPPAMMQIIDQD